MENEYAVGQRWISEPEPDLGLGTVVELSKGRVQVLFSASGEMRMYAAAGAPLKRVRFKIGDTITTESNEQLTIEDIQEMDNLITYVGNGVSVPEANLSDAISFDTAEDRLLSGQLDGLRAFDLRYRTHVLRHHQRSSAVRGFIGGRIDLIPHQLYIAHEVSSRHAPRVLLSDEVGLGKTIEACLIIHRMLRSSQASRVLIVVPESLVHQWFVELLRRFNLWVNIYDEERCVAVAPGAPDNNPFLDDQLILCSLYFLNNAPKRAAQARAAGWDVLVVDEAHHLAWSVEEASPAYQLIDALSQGAQGLLLLTATPEQLGVESHFGRLRLLDPDRYNDFKAFQKAADTYRDIATVVEKVIAEQPLTKAEQTYVLQRFKDAPDHMAEQLASPLSGQAKQAFVEELLDLHGPGRVLLRNTRANMTGFPSRLPKLISLPLPKGEAPYMERMKREFAYDTGLSESEPRYVFADDARLSWLIAFLKEQAEEKVLLICRTKKKALALHEALRKQVNISAGIFHEDLTLVQRDRNAAWFAEADGARLLICSEIGSEGRNFQFAHHLVLFDLPINPELLEQRIGRLDRIGQKADIHIHIPFLAGSPQNYTARWYHEGLQAFERNLSGTNDTLVALAAEIRTLAHKSAGKSDKDILAQLDQRILDTRKAHLALKKSLQDGRDRLIELNSFRPDTAQHLIADIEQEDQDVTLENYMLEILESVGVQVEEHAPRTYYLNPQRITIEAFPEIPDDGITVTFDRQRALVREEIQFLSWDHPMVTGALDVMLGVEKGNSSYGILVDEEESDMLIEAVFVLEPVAKEAAAVDRFLPATPIRVVVNRMGEDLSDVHTPALFEQLLRKGKPDRLLDNNRVTQDLIPSMLDAAQAVANAHATAIKSAKREAMQTQLATEINRLRYLQHMNSNVRPDEIELAQHQLLAFGEAIEHARLRLDALRLIWQGPAALVG
ncbi:MAG: RNA polymerase-associated protein RapA [Bacteroidota bacterium]